MGIPIKDRGIKWEETYGDKSAYLKQQMEEQIGPGSYFRWEGHDHTSGEDYYVVVTPGFSKKHGFHFFAALRKIPADHGASGKKFKTQGEALSYAMDTWRVPMPKTKPHKPYIVRDLEGKPIVLENVHSGFEPRVTRIATKEKSMIVIDATNKTAMSLPVSGRHGEFFRSAGPRSLPAIYNYAARAASIMGYGAAMYLVKEFGLIDKFNQGEGQFTDEQTGQKSGQILPMLATCENPNEQSFQQLIHEMGITQRSKLYSIKNGAVELKRPAYEGAEESENYNIIRFRDITKLAPVYSIGPKKRHEFNQIMSAMMGVDQQPVVDAQGNPETDENGQPLMGTPLVGPNREPVRDANGQLQFVRDAEGRPIPKLQSTLFKDAGGNPLTISRKPLKAPGAGKRENWLENIVIPIDMYQQASSYLSGVASRKKMPFQAENAIELFQHLQQSHDLTNPEAFEQAMNTPVFEEIKMRGGPLVVYDERMRPLGIQISKDNHVDMEGFSEGGTKHELQYIFADGVVERLLAEHGSYENLRSAFARNQVQLTHDMFVDTQTAAPMIHPVRSTLPRVDNNLIPQRDEQGRLIKERRDVVPPFQIHAAQNKVRVYDTATGEQKIVPLPEGTDASQTFQGAQALSKNTTMYVPIQRQDPATGQTVEDFHPVGVGEWKHYDARSRGKFVPGNVYTLMVKPANASSKKSDIAKQYKLGQEREGFFMGYKETYAWKQYKEGAPIPRHAGQVVEITLRDGRVLPVPADNNPSDPAIQALQNPQQIEGYYYVTQRQHPGKPFTSHKPSADNPIEVQRWVRNPDGSVSVATDSAGNEMPPLRLTENEVVSEATPGKKTPTYMKSMGSCVQYLMARFGMTEFDIGRYTDVHAEDLRVIDDKYMEAQNRIEAAGGSTEQLSEWEQILSKFKEGSDFVPPEFLQRASAISTSNPEDFAPKNGPIYSIRLQGQPEDWVTDEVFGTQVQADDFKRALEHDQNFMREMSARSQGQPQLEVAVKSENAPLVVSMRHAVERGESPSLTHNTDISDAVSDLQGLAGEEVTDNGEMFEEPGEEGEEEGVPTPAPAEVAEAPAAPPLISQPQPEPAAAPAAVDSEWLPDWGGLVDNAPATPAPAPAAPVPGKPKAKPSDVEASTALERLIKLADKLDSQGRGEEADAVDRLIQITMAKMGSN